MESVFDKNHELGIGFYLCEKCGEKYYNGWGYRQHKKTCDFERNGDGGWKYHFGRKEVGFLRALGWETSLTPLTREVIEELCPPDLLEEMGLSSPPRN